MGMDVTDETMKPSGTIRPIRMIVVLLLLEIPQAFPSPFIDRFLLIAFQFFFCLRGVVEPLSLSFSFSIRVQNAEDIPSVSTWMDSNLIVTIASDPIWVF